MHADVVDEFRPGRSAGTPNGEGKGESRGQKCASRKLTRLGGEYEAVPEFAMHAACYHLRKELDIDCVPVFLRLENITCSVKPVLDDAAIHPINLNLKRFAKHPDYESRVRYPKNFKAALFRNDTRACGVRTRAHY